MIDRNIIDELVKSENIHTKKYTYLNEKTGSLETTYQIYDSVIPFLKYKTAHSELFISGSLPKMLYGNNIREVDKQGIQDFFNLIRNRIEELFNVHIADEYWKITNIEVSKNFILKNQKQVNDYIRNLATIKLPRKTTIPYDNETVWFKNGSVIYKCYNKYKQMKKEKIHNDELLQQAENILRFEVEAKDYLLRDFSPNRLAVELLTEEFYNHIMTDVIEQINERLVNAESKLTTNIFNNDLNATQREMAYSFILFSDTFGESYLKEHYSPAQIRQRKKLVMKLKQSLQSEEEQMILKL